MELPTLQYIESQGTRWPVSKLRYLLGLKPADLKAEIQRLIGDAEPAAAPITESTPEPKEP